MQPGHQISSFAQFCSQIFFVFLLNDVQKENLDVDYVATGHYASTSYGNYQESRNEQKKSNLSNISKYKLISVRLLTAADPLKDQTYFLCTLNQSQLKRAMFPLGSLMKTRVKKIAEEQGFMDIAQKPESMGICFVGKRKKFDEFMDQVRAFSF